LKARKDLGLNTMIELIQKDRGCTEEEAKRILQEILKEKIEQKMQEINDNETALDSEQNMQIEEREEEEQENGEDDENNEDNS